MMIDYNYIKQQAEREVKYKSLKNIFNFLLFHDKLTATSELVKDLDYVFNPHTLTCSCDQFVRRSLIYNKDDPRRFCNHIIHFLIDNTDLEEQAAMILESYLKFEEIYLFKENFRNINQEYRYVFQLNYQSEWLTVYQKIIELHDYTLAFSPQKFGYNLEKGYWFNDAEPEKLIMLEMIDYIIKNRNELIGDCKSDKSIC